MRRKATLRGSIVAILMSLAMILTAAPAFAAGGPGGGSSGGRGNRGGGGTETVPNNLSVPTVFIGGNPFNFNCDGSSYAMPMGTPANGYPLSPSTYYYLQGTSSWQASCTTADSATATGNWGDNIVGGSAALKTGSPIRVEMGLLSDTTTAYEGMTGFNVYKLEPDALDRVSAYGTPATVNADGTFSGTPVKPFYNADGVAETRIWTAGATMVITGPNGYVQNVAFGTGEINATGRVVYGYNWTAPTSGEYTLTFTAPNVTFTGTNGASMSGDTATITVNVTASTGGGQGKGHRG